MTGQSGSRYRARQAISTDDLAAVQKLRSQCFRDGSDEDADTDQFDIQCNHILVEDASTETLVCCFRLLNFKTGRDIGGSYSAQFYDLKKLENYQQRMVEMGRFCIRPGLKDPDILRIAWAAMADYVEENQVELLFGCSSFHGVDADEYEDAFALLKERHLAPKRWLPKVKAPRVFRYATRLKLRKPDLKAAMKGMPPLLRTYLLMGGWVSDHAVVDHDLNTLHVFTGLEIASISPVRKRLLRGGV